MPLTPGTYLGPYRIAGQIGAGGMGEVYRARDSKLNRDVALKVIAAAFALEPERLARFRREAQVLAALNHPHIGGIYGFEDSGETHALVLELVEGDTLADRIARAPVPVHEAVPIARQIADALAGAHEQGITHRDLKPANIKITPDGVVKVLDFGLAKLNAPTVQDDPNAPNSRSLSPTITSPAMMTGVGMLLGTAAYMSPEQAKGREADKRSDIWAFGCVLYEMLTGRRAFDGEDLTDVLGAVVRLEPNWAALPSDVPPPIRTLLQQCLIKDRRARIGDIATALFVLDHQASGAPTSETSAVPLPRRLLWRRLVAMTAGALAVGIAVGGSVWFVMRPVPALVERFTINPDGSAPLTLGVERSVAITPDGTRVIYVGNRGTQLFVRPLDQLKPGAIVKGSGLRGVFVSPDGQWVGFAEMGSVLKKVAITGGPSMTVAQMDSASRGATWAPDDTIIFATVSPATGLQRVSAAGGEPTLLTKPNRERGEADHWWPELLPGGKAVLFTIFPANGTLENAQIALLDLQTGTWRVIIRGGSHAHYASTGHIVYGAMGTLRAVAFDLGRLEVDGTAALVLEGVVTTAMGAVDGALAANGSFVYIPGGADDAGPQIVMRVDRKGGASPLAGIRLDAYRDVRVSPEGRRLALATQNDVWIYDFTRTTLSPLTTDPAYDYSPLWTPDGQRIVFTSRRNGYPELWWRAADGTGSDERFLTRAKDLTDLRANGWSPDRKHLLFTEASRTSTIGQIGIERPSDATVLVNGDSPSALSPDGRSMAYQSLVAGRWEIFVERYPELGGRQQISTGGGARPLWSHDGRELFFVSVDGRQMFVTAVQSGTTLVAENPRVLFELPMLVPIRGNRPYDVTPDGQFVIIRSGEADAAVGTSSNLILVKNWFEELRRLVPTN